METYVVIILIKRNQEKIEIEVSVHHPEHILKELNKQFSNYEILSIERITTCEGCLLGLMGQQDHMATGGCLYDPDY